MNGGKERMKEVEIGRTQKEDEVRRGKENERRIGRKEATTHLQPP